MCKKTLLKHRNCFNIWCECVYKFAQVLKLKSIQCHDITTRHVNKIYIYTLLSALVNTYFASLFYSNIQIAISLQNSSKLKIYSKPLTVFMKPLNLYEKNNLRVK